MHIDEQFVYAAWAIKLREWSDLITYVDLLLASTTGPSGAPRLGQVGGGHTYQGGLNFPPWSGGLNLLDKKKVLIKEV